MHDSPGDGLERMKVAMPRLIIGAVGTLLVALAACSDSLPIAPTRDPLAGQPLPAAARYIVGLASPGPVPARFADAVKAAGG